jgi:hypothetical protein
MLGNEITVADTTDIKSEIRQKLLFFDRFFPTKEK